MSLDSYFFLFLIIILFPIKWSFLVRRMATVWGVKVLYFKLSGRKLTFFEFPGKQAVNQGFVFLPLVLSFLLNNMLTLWICCVQVLSSRTCGSCRSLWWRTSSTTTGSRPPSQCLLLVCNLTWFLCKHLKRLLCPSAAFRTKTRGCRHCSTPVRNCRRPTTTTSSESLCPCCSCSSALQRCFENEDH